MNFRSLLEMAVNARQCDATAAYNAARALPYAPLGRIDYEWGDFRLRTLQLTRNLSMSIPMREKQLRDAMEVANEAIEHFEKYKTIPHTEMIALWHRDREDTLRAITAPPVVHNMQAQAPTTSDIIAAFNTRGISLSLAGKKLNVSPASRLTEDDKRLIAQHREALVEMLGNDTVTL